MEEENGWKVGIIARGLKVTAAKHDGLIVQDL